VVEDFETYVTVAWPRLLRSAWLLTGDWHLAEDEGRYGLPSIQAGGRGNADRPVFAPEPGSLTLSRFLTVHNGDRDRHP
jgi:hypothetical protein